MLTKLLKGRRIGRISRYLAPDYGGCLRCKTTWAYVKAHHTIANRTTGCFPLCKKCWAELTPQTRLPFYRQLYVDANGKIEMRRDSWADVEAAVLDGG